MLTTPISQGARAPRSLTSRCCMGCLPLVRCAGSGMLRCGSSSSAAVYTMHRCCGSGWPSSPPCRGRRALSSRAVGRSPTRCARSAAGPGSGRSSRASHGDPCDAAVRAGAAGHRAAAGAGRDRGRAARGESAVWLPWHLAGREPTIAASWDVTSDSLACWLATRLGASDLVLIKSAGLEQIAAEPGAWLPPAWSIQRSRRSRHGSKAESGSSIATSRCSSRNSRGRGLSCLKGPGVSEVPLHQPSGGRNLQQPCAVTVRDSKAAGPRAAGP